MKLQTIKKREKTTKTVKLKKLKFYAGIIKVSDKNIVSNIDKFKLNNILEYEK